MNVTLVEGDAKAYLDVLDPITRVDDALDLVSACASHQTDRVLLTRFADDFFDLSTKLAGEFVQKLYNYKIRAAAVFPPGSYGERFGEFVREAKHGSLFRAFEDRAEAEAWLRL